MGKGLYRLARACRFVHIKEEYLREIGAGVSVSDLDPRYDKRLDDSEVFLMRAVLEGASKEREDR